MKKLTGAQIVVDSLRREGVKTVFGLPGNQIMHLYDAFYEQSDINLITVRHEQAAVYMADGYNRVRGAPEAAAVVVPGPGVQNASAALGTAYACSSPTMLLAGQIPSDFLGLQTGQLHEIHHQIETLKGITKWHSTSHKVSDISSDINKAFKSMKSNRPRPTAIEIPPDILAAKGSVTPSPAAQRKTPSLNLQNINQAAAILKKAQKPIIWAGGGVVISEASNLLTQLAEILGAIVVTTPEGKGSIPENHQLSGGVCYYGHGSSGWYAQEADVVLAIGTRLTQQMRGPTALTSSQQLIHIDIDQEVVNKNYPASVSVIADAKEAIKALLVKLSSHSNKQPWPNDFKTQVTQEFSQWLTDTAPLQGEIIKDIQQVLAEDAIYVSGITNIGYWSHFYYQVTHPRTYFTSSYFATLGYSFPFALGAKCASPKSQVVCVIGDGGFGYSLQELSTAVKYGINVVAIVFVDNALGASLHDQTTKYHNRVIGTNLHNPDFVLAAEAFGAKGIKATPQNISIALEEAIFSNQPCVIEVSIPQLLKPPFQVPLRN
jgi:acetolactate synthase-1/2/3 large subunit